MTTKSDLLDAINAAADAYLAGTPADEDDANRRRSVAIALGTPGQRIEIEGTTSNSNAALSPEPTVFATLVEGLADWLNAELIAQFNQLLDDYNKGVVPSSARKIGTPS
jgi:hypothetical protein